MAEVTNLWTSKGHKDTQGDGLVNLIIRDGQFRAGDVHERVYWSPINWDGGYEDVERGKEIGRLMVLNAIVSTLKKYLPFHKVPSQ